MSTVLLFSHTSDFLGEVRLSDGTLEHVMLTHTGEERIGAGVNDWRTRGIPVRRELFGMRERPKDIVFFQERIQPRDKGFFDALRLWCADHDVTLVTLSSSIQMHCWTVLQHLPFTADERFVMCGALAHAEADELVAWHGFLTEAESTVHLERQKADAAIVKLQQKAAESLVKRFSRTTRTAHA
jgi:hypothetical protein